FGDGATHQAVEDIAIMRAIPNMTVICPADANETVQAVKAVIDMSGPCYIRLNRVLWWVRLWKQRWN
ncbi:MAG: transketolase subunit, partial [Firmicutes bacterium]|nr:transketolase subunit [Bacillota bacterium]